MRTWHLHRDVLHPHETLGVLTSYILTGALYTIERGLADPDHPAIPNGTYTLKLGMYNHGGYPAYEVLNVPGRSQIKIHAANYASELLGCIAPGLARVISDVQPSMVTYSKKALAQFMADSGGDDEMLLTIT